MKRLLELNKIGEEMFGGIRAGEELKRRIFREAQEDAHTRVRLPVRAFAFACAALIMIAAGSLTLPKLFLDNGSEEIIQLDTQAAGSDTLRSFSEKALLDVPPGSIKLTDSASPSYRGIWASKSGGNFPLLCVEGRYYRLLNNPSSIGNDLLGSQLGAVDTHTSEPALASGGIISNTAAQGETVYAVKNMSGAMAAANVDGVMRVFQRVSFGNSALIGGESLADTLGGGSVTGMELTGVGTVTDAAAASALFNTLTGNASFVRSGTSDTNSTLLIQFSSGLAVQLCVKDDSLMACGTWSCPDFFEAFKAAVE